MHTDIQCSIMPHFPTGAHISGCFNQTHEFDFFVQHILMEVWKDWFRSAQTCQQDSEATSETMPQSIRYRECCIHVAVKCSFGTCIPLLCWTNAVSRSIRDIGLSKNAQPMHSIKNSRQKEGMNLLLNRKYFVKIS